MRKTTTLALIAGALVALGCGAGTTDDTTGSKADSGTEAAAGDTDGGKADAGKSDDKPKTAKIGQPARDGKFEFTVKSAKCGVSKVGSSAFGAKAQGQFCLVTLNVKNIGKESQMFDGSSQKAYAANGTEYSADGSAAIYANKNAETFLNDINPGNQVTGVVVFDIPKNVKLAKLELHDSPFSGGVTVSLS
ncbi:MULTISPECIES: DUF4352 domain-containing protein [Micromonospora]|uniref:DUF4352 domain-containing protein n=1 Tax=Micromonospora chalcea TaxID=1874 RepID=A0ABX9Y2X2_MICCH|nr:MULTISPECIES: DUF4352 domain-containing protein [Micromonospora]ODB73840.1 hypothetical protein A8711_10020 [Micromonospora sp. II]RQW91924.1 DUF4352 domain-containing protein [Micromonospora chalcea]RQX29981.1 DUF4352 domain-containing protein [Micromonospora chalcea]